jgi:alpha-D-ribose 1-methylphosphonate 5-triphosphate synthase subunit PhnI
MSNLVPAGTNYIATRQNRYKGRALARIDDQTDIGLAQIESQAELQVGRVMAVGYVGKRAMHEVALVSQLEQQLATLVPLATSRLQVLGDIVALEAADVVADTVRKVNR